MQDVHSADAAAGAMRAPFWRGNALLARLLALSIVLHAAALALLPPPAGLDADAASSALDVVLAQPPEPLPLVRAQRRPPESKMRTERTQPQVLAEAARVQTETSPPKPVIALAAEAAPPAAAFSVPQKNADAKPAEDKAEIAARSAAPATAVRDTGATTAPNFNAAYLRNTPPQYPFIARRNGEQGTVRVRVLVTLDGYAGRVQLDQSSGSAALDQAALDTVKSWRFVPARRGNDTVESWVIVPIVFRLENA